MFLYIYIFPIALWLKYYMYSSTLFLFIQSSISKLYSKYMDIQFLFELLLQHCLERHHLFSINHHNFKGRVKVYLVTVCAFSDCQCWKNGLQFNHAKIRHAIAKRQSIRLTLVERLSPQHAVALSPAAKFHDFIIPQCCY